MTTATFAVGDEFRVQFVWRIGGGDFLRAIFRVEVLQLDLLSEKYVIGLLEFVAGRQESYEGAMRHEEEVDRQMWALAIELEGRKVSLSFEAADGRPLWLRLETLTGEHDYFTRLSQLPPSLSDLNQEQIEKLKRRIRKGDARGWSETSEGDHNNP